MFWKSLLNNGHLWYRDFVVERGFQAFQRQSSIGYFGADHCYVSFLKNGIYHHIKKRKPYLIQYSIDYLIFNCFQNNRQDNCHHSYHSSVYICPNRLHVLALLQAKGAEFCSTDWKGWSFGAIVGKFFSDFGIVE